MHCPKCGGATSKVTDTRKFDTLIVRMRQCLNHACLHGWRTTELIDDIGSRVLAKDNQAGLRK